MKKKKKISRRDGKRNTKFFSKLNIAHVVHRNRFMYRK